MTEEHHDPELCRRLAEKVMDWKQVEYYWVTNNEVYEYIIFDGEPFPWSMWDPCCDPITNWMLEQRMAELGFDYERRLNCAIFQRGTEMVVGRSDHRLHATALAADAAIPCRWSTGDDGLVTWNCGGPGVCSDPGHVKPPLGKPAASE